MYIQWGTFNKHNPTAPLMIVVSEKHLKEGAGLQYYIPIL